MTENRHYKALELDKILAMLAEQTGCEDSRRLALETEPKTTLREAQRLMDRTARICLPAGSARPAFAESRT